MDDIDRVMKHLNLKTGAKFQARGKKGLTSSGTLIKARLASGYTLEQLIMVIDAKHEEWHDSPMAKFLRPETLFGKRKCEGYIGQLGVTITTKDTSGPRDWLNTKKDRR